MKLVKSFCIKSNKQSILNYLLNSFKKEKPNNFYVVKKSFKIYDNIIYHYTGSSNDMFFDYVADNLKNVILSFYEKKIISNIINYNYFYFSDIEKHQILKSCMEYLSEETTEVLERKNVIFYLCKEYIKDNKSVILDGFVNFRLKEYIKILDSIVESCVNSFVVEKEYLEFIHLLKIYIDSQSNSNSTIHLIYFNQESILLDEKKNVIALDKDITNAKYLSDITFSSNDYCLNTLLNILPKRIYLHLLDDKEDEFITTLKSIFGKRIAFCLDCNICNHYRQQHV